MLFIIIFVCTIFIIWKLGIDSLSKRFIIPYIGVWFIALFISSEGFLGLLKPCNDTIELLIIHIYTFLLGFLFIRKKSFHTIINIDSIYSQFESLVKNRFFIIVVIVAFLYILSVFSIFLNAASFYQSLFELRTEYYEGNLYGPVYSLLDSYVFIPLDYALYPIFGYMSLRKRNWVWIIITLYLFMHASLGGGRFGYVRVILGLFFIAFCITQYHTDVIKYVKTILKVGLAAFFVYILLSVVSAGRMGDSVDVSKENIEYGQTVLNDHLVYYMGGPISAFDVATQHHFEFKIGGFQDGLLTLSTFEYIYYVLSTKIDGIGYIRPIAKAAEVLQNQPIDVGTPFSWNALYTSCLYYYLDFGIWGVIIIPLFFGLFIGYAITLFYRYQNLPSVLLICFLFIKIMTSISQFTFVNFGELIYLFLLMYLTQRKKGRSLLLWFLQHI